MKKFIVFAFMAASLFADIKMSDSEMKKMGIALKTAVLVNSETVGPFVGSFDFDDSKSKNYILPSDGVVVRSVKMAGDAVKKGDVLCIISSAELAANGFELREARSRLKILDANAKKDEALYKDGVISQREYQKSAFEASMLASRVAELESRFSVAGVSSSSDGMFAVKAKTSGVLSLAPKKAGQKIEPFIPYLKISESSSLAAYIKIPPTQLVNIKKGAIVTDRTSNKIGVLIAVSGGVDETTNSAGAVAKITAKNESFRAGTAYEFFISTPKAKSLMMLPRSSVTKYKNTDVCFIRTKDGFVPKRVSVVKDTKDGVYIKNNDIADGASVAVGGIVNLKGALSGMGFE